MLPLFLEGRPNAGQWWNNVTSRPGDKQLEDYPGQSEDDQPPHVVTGLQLLDELRVLLGDIRAS